MGIAIAVGIGLYYLIFFFRLMIWGRGIFFPDFRRIDLVLKEKDSTGLYDKLPQWNSFIGKFAYYLLLSIFLGSIALVYYACSALLHF